MLCSYHITERVWQLAVYLGYCIWLLMKPRMFKAFWWFQRAVASWAETSSLPGVPDLRIGKVRRATVIPSAEVVEFSSERRF